jgi:uncharacterized membrane protein
LVIVPIEAAKLFYIFFEWIEFLVRWLHVIAGIAWIGSSFYFIALDLSLQNKKDMPKQAHGEAWQVHGGGFYQIIKYLVAPEKMPSQLTWFKWEAYGTWISGFLLLILVYYLSADLYMIEIEKFDLTKFEAISISLIGIILGWVLYNFICKKTVNKNNNVLAIFILFIFTIFSWLYFQVFSYRGAYMQIGSMLGTIMVANVLMIIIPGQKKVVKSLIENKKPDAIHGITAKQRSLHNNYLTLPVIFIMISNHYPTIYATEYSWIIISLIIIVGALIRQFFNIKHSGKKPPYLIWIPITIIVLFLVYLSDIGKPNLSSSKKNAELIIQKIPKTLVVASEEIIISKCSMCHAKEPIWENMKHSPKQINLENIKDIVQNIDSIYSQAVMSYAMPPGNITFLENSERKTLNDLYNFLKRL